jgi:hypothetical protein
MSRGVVAHIGVYEDLKASKSPAQNVPELGALESLGLLMTMSHQHLVGSITDACAKKWLSEQTHASLVHCRSLMGRRNMVRRWPSEQRHVVLAFRVRGQTPISDGWRQRFALSGIHGPIVEEVHGLGAVRGGVVHGHAS